MVSPENVFIRNENMKASDTSYWYALRVTYSREMMVKKHCDANNIINFIPLEYRMCERDGVIIKKLQPVIRNLIFVKTSMSCINELKRKYPIRYIMNRGTGDPVIVPEKQMLDFIAVAGNYDQQVVFLAPCELRAKTGSRVRIRDGIFKGVEGVLVRVRNDKRVVVQIEGLVMVATHYIHPSLLEYLE